MMTSKPTKARWLALSLLSGKWDSVAVADRLSRALPPDFTELGKASARLLFRFDESSPPDVDALVEFILSEPLFRPALESAAIKGPLLDSPVMAELPETLVTFPLPDLATWSDVGSWLSLSDKEVAWFADMVERMVRKAGGTDEDIGAVTESMEQGRAEAKPVDRDCTDAGGQELALTLMQLLDEVRSGLERRRA